MVLCSPQAALSLPHRLLGCPVFPADFFQKAGWPLPLVKLNPHTWAAISIPVQVQLGRPTAPPPVVSILLSPRVCEHRDKGEGCVCKDEGMRAYKVGEGMHAYKGEIVQKGGCARR